MYNSSREGTYLIEHFSGEPLATLAALEWFFSIMEALVVLLQVADPVEAFVAFVAPEVATAWVG